MRIVILAKAPVAGSVKTRMMPQYSAQEAANLHVRMTIEVVRKATNICNNVWLAVDDESHSLFTELAARYAIKLCDQGSGDLGDRLTSLMLESFSDSDDCLLFLGTDSPHIAETRYLEALECSASSDVVIGPVEDGGYDLILLKQLDNDIFKDITWGSEYVFQQTVNVCQRKQLKVHILDLSFDLDRPEDIKRAPPESW